MTIPTDRAFIAELRARTDTALPQMSLDGLAVRTAGRRATRARRWVAAGGGLTAVLAVFVVTGGALSVFTSSPAVGPAAQGPVVTASSSQTLAAGVAATTAVSGDGSPWSTGLTLTGSDGTFAVELLAGTQEDLQEAQAGADSPLDHAVRVTVSGVDPAESLVVAWADEQQAPTGERPSPLSTRTMFRVENAWGTNGSRIMAGVVPSWLSDAHVVLFSADGVTDPSGQLVHAVEVPTFADPAGSGGRLYLVVTDPRVPVNQGPVRGIAFVAPDGTFLDADGDCARAPELCAGVQPDGLDLRSELLSALTR